MDTSCNSTYRLRYWNKLSTEFGFPIIRTLQQYLPFTVLKLTREEIEDKKVEVISCNSTYRLRYWNDKIGPDFLKSKPRLQQYLPFTVLKL